MKHTASRKSAFSLKQQSAYGTALAEVDINKAHPIEGESQVEHELEKWTDKDEYGKGHHWTTEQKNLTASTSLSRSYRLSSFIASWASAFSLGDVTESQPDQSGSPSVYQLDIKPINISDSTVGQQLPVTTYVESLAPNLQFLYRDLLVKGFKLSGKLKEFLKLSMDMVGSGWEEENSMAMPSLLQTSFLRFPDVIFSYGGTEYTAKLKSFEFGFDSELDEDGGYQPGSGYLYPDTAHKAQVRSQLLATGQSASFKFQVCLENKDILNDFKQNAERALVLSAEGDVIENDYRHKIMITIPKAVLTANKIGNDNKLLVYDCEVGFNWDSATAAPFSIQIITDVSGILALPA